MEAGVYKIMNKINDKYYIGSSVDLDRRFYSHRKTLKENPLLLKVVLIDVLSKEKHGKEKP